MSTDWRTCSNVEPHGQHEWRFEDADYDGRVTFFECAGRVVDEWSYGLGVTRCIKVLEDLGVEQERLSEHNSQKHLVATNARDQTAITQTRTFGWKIDGRREMLDAAIAALSSSSTTTGQE